MACRRAEVRDAEQVNSEQRVPGTLLQVYRGFRSTWYTLWCVVQCCKLTNSGPDRLDITRHDEAEST